MPESQDTLKARLVDRLCSEFKTDWSNDTKPDFESFLKHVDSTERESLLESLLKIDIDLRIESGEQVNPEDYRQLGIPEEALVGLLFHDGSQKNPAQSTADEQELAESLTTLAPPSPLAGKPALPDRIGRYRVEKILGKGGFGLVFRAYDDQLERHVAIKVPHASLISRPEDAQLYLTEARTVAKLDHPNIVPVYDVGQTTEFPCFVVSKYIEGMDLSARIKQQRLSFHDAAELIATVATALHYAHKQGLIHRDVKPGNILLDSDGIPFVVDFGLAIKEQDLGQGSGYIGTPAYMSPEQARGESHRVDGRSDIFSLGIVFYELLVGRRPFQGENHQQLLEQITSQESKPLREIDDFVPKELERICLKSLAKKASERYSKAIDFAEDLRYFLKPQLFDATRVTSGIPEVLPTGNDSTRDGVDSDKSKSDSDKQLIRIVPKGLRSFDAHDADFFLELLPGPRDREGLPDSLRLWKTRIEETDSDKTFTVGLIYGPSGCGKSSLVKAGFLPRLSGQVISVYLEAMPEDTETRLLHGIRKNCPALAINSSLKETLAALRRGEGLVTGQKVLIILDQFEQWLHTHQQQEHTELVDALRQCDSQHLQCIVMVRDDFWMAATRFMRELEVRLVEALNSFAVDLFSERHAEKVLSAFGRAFGSLPETSNEISSEQQQFIKQSVTGLADDGKVICVRLALFAEMIKGKSWIPALLNEIGGTEGVGLTFLEETFSASSSPPEHRYHQKAARAVLQSLLPASGTNIKGKMNSFGELLEASGYANRPKDFNDLLKILDSEIRLITPTDPAGMETETDSVSEFRSDQKYYQLTHDYLVPSLRDWLTRKQRETRRGRAELLLAERSATWNAKPENRYLPSWWEHASIRLLTTGKKWTPAQQALMRRTRLRHAAQAASLLLVIFLVSSATYLTYGWFQGRSSIEVLLNADAQNVLPAAQRAARFRRWNTGELRQLLESEPETAEQRRHQLHARLALVEFDPAQIEPLVDQLLEADQLTYVGVIRQSLKAHSVNIVGELWTRLSDPQQTVKKRFRSGLALAMFEPDSQQWSAERIQFIVDQLVSANAVYQPQLWELMAPVDTRLVKPLRQIFVDSGRSENERLAAANALVHFLPDDAAQLAELLTVATPAQFQIVYESFNHVAEARSLNYLRQSAAERLSDDLNSDGRIEVGKLRASIGFALLRQGDLESTLAVLRYDSDPEAMTQFIQGCRAAGVTASELEECFWHVDKRSGPLGENRQKNDASTLYALLLALGEFEVGDLPDAKPLTDRLVEVYARDPSP